MAAGQLRQHRRRRGDRLGRASGRSTTTPTSGSSTPSAGARLPGGRGGHDPRGGVRRPAGADRRGQRSADVPPTLARGARGQVLMATVRPPPRWTGARLLGEDNVLVLGDQQIDLVALKAALAERGSTEQLSEGGPSLFADLLATGRGRRAVLDGRAEADRRRRRPHRHGRRRRRGAASRPAAGAGRDAAGALAGGVSPSPVISRGRRGGPWRRRGCRRGCGW